MNRSLGTWYFRDRHAVPERRYGSAILPREIVHAGRSQGREIRKRLNRSAADPWWHQAFRILLDRIPKKKTGTPDSGMTCTTEYGMFPCQTSGKGKSQNRYTAPVSRESPYPGMTGVVVDILGYFRRSFTCPPCQPWGNYRPVNNRARQEGSEREPQQAPVILSGYHACTLSSLGKS